jgi:hypothetical protein
MIKFHKTTHPSGYLFRSSEAKSCPGPFKQAIWSAVFHPAALIINVTAAAVILEQQVLFYLLLFWYNKVSY